MSRRYHRLAGGQLTASLRSVCRVMSSDRRNMSRAVQPAGTEPALPLRVRSWYGVHAQVRAASGTECDLVVEGKEFPHPSVVNLFIRRGLAPDGRLRLGAWHEVGHLQTLPFAAFFALVMVWPPLCGIPATGRENSPRSSSDPRRCGKWRARRKSSQRTGRADIAKRARGHLGTCCSSGLLRSRRRLPQSRRCVAATRLRVAADLRNGARRP